MSLKWSTCLPGKRDGVDNVYDGRALCSGVPCEQETLKYIDYKFCLSVLPVRLGEGGCWIDPRSLLKKLAGRQVMRLLSLSKLGLSIMSICF